MAAAIFDQVDVHRKTVIGAMALLVQADQAAPVVQEVDHVPAVTDAQTPADRVLKVETGLSAAPDVRNKAVLVPHKGSRAGDRKDALAVNAEISHNARVSHKFGLHLSPLSFFPRPSLWKKSPSS